MDEKRLGQELKRSKDQFLREWQGSSRVWSGVEQGDGRHRIWNIKVVAPLAVGLALLVAFLTVDFNSSKELISDQDIYNFYVELIDQGYESESLTAYDELGSVEEDGVRPGV
ncbi:MAG: hypothetical protein HN353_08015 [Bdellovibrionales bacterium]|jgi:hypothetical protein|nr:hypothetical protein [Bdellovibrionales bacterium]MBT3525865.1 hypothetical protein [Bdellovibrionales bacterium]MBT7670114.1 hypothetical protein [Bdellovibrionales bacterium]MBT7766601.1 hypothetical protein [Bdellovibrionales bacterium]